VTTGYPSGPDSFHVPSNPEETPLSQAGAGNTRNLTTSIGDQGAAIMALEADAALKTHDHSGDPADINKGSKLAETFTHQGSDVDTSESAKHHTIGLEATQAAAGNHNHDYDDLIGIPWENCLSTARPPAPVLGMKIYETDTHVLRVWDQFPGDSAPAWRVMLGALVPVCRIRQGTPQTINPAGSPIEWNTTLEDSFGYFNVGASMTDVVIKDAGLFHISAAIQFDDSFVPDVAHVVLCLNGVETTVRTSQFIRGNLFTPGFSQTMTVTGPLRFNAGDVLTVKVSYTFPGLILWFLSFFDGPNHIMSRLDVVFASP
jgi:hypothetical protein